MGAGEDKLKTCPLEFGDEHQGDTIATRNLDGFGFIEVTAFVEGNFDERLLSKNGGWDGKNDGAKLCDDSVLRPVVRSKVVKFVRMAPWRLDGTRIIFRLGLCCRRSCEKGVGGLG